VKYPVNTGYIQAKYTNGKNRYWMNYPISFLIMGKRFSKISGLGASEARAERLQNELYQQIGKLKVEHDWLKKNSNSKRMIH